jgi:catechol 2,3-dioxygenase-like lactoylglutathione lyase family enzyme
VSAMNVTEMEHVLLLSDDIDQACEFYCTVVGLRVGTRPPLEFPGYWLYARDTPCLHIAERSSYRAHATRIGLEVSDDPGGPGPVDHIAFNATDYDELSRRLERSGVAAIRNTVPGGGPRQLFIPGPDGVRIEINVRQSPTEAR